MYLAYAWFNSRPVQRLMVMKHYLIKVYGESGRKAPPFLTSAVDESKWSASRLDPFTLGERAGCTHWVGGWVGRRAGLDTVEKRKIICPCGELNHVLPDRTSYRLSYPGSSKIL
jgi:hypothetical protein